MPELPEEMYCSQQICIPPSFPYLLRQYAKAAIRTQPADLLRWSTAYFRCLSLNLRPPTKPRLEYPIPKSHFGLTPGWLRALMYQLQNNLTIPFKTLWDRWIGACLQHQNLIEILCLGGFTDVNAIPWFRFVALCASHLTESLTQTMILVCEIITEEPEGGSAMIPLETFVDVYKFLAAIDAAEPQYIRNLHFTDSLLSLYREPPAEVIKEVISEVTVEEEEESVEEEEKKEEVVVVKSVVDLVGVVISCPDIAADDYKREEDFPLQSESAESDDIVSLVSTKTDTQKSQPATTPDATSPKSGAEELSQVEGEQEPKPSEATETSELQKGSADTLLDYMPPREGHSEKEATNAEEEEEEEEEEEAEEEAVEEEEMSDLDKPKMLEEPTTGSGLISVATEETEEKKEEVEEEEEKQNLIWVDTIPGIGPALPEQIMDTAIKYMQKCAIIQQGMVMPRNIRHYSCPPLEILNK